MLIKLTFQRLLYRSYGFKTECSFFECNAINITIIHNILIILYSIKQFKMLKLKVLMFEILTFMFCFNKKYNQNAFFLHKYLRFFLLAENLHQIHSIINLQKYVIVLAPILSKALTVAKSTKQ